MLKSIKILSILIIIALFSVNTTLAQKKEKRKSPAKVAEGTIDGRFVMVRYGSPSVNGREIYGALVPYGEVWRTGANEATTLEFAGDIELNGRTLDAGKYSVFTIPGKEKWTVIINSEAEQWGAYKYDSSKDVLRLEVTPQEVEFTESLKFSVEKSYIQFAWEKVGFQLQVVSP